jgi:hypothetical protein
VRERFQKKREFAEWVRTQPERRGEISTQEIRKGVMGECGGFSEIKKECSLLREREIEQ